MGGRQTRKNCSFCAHLERDILEENINSGVYSSEDLVNITIIVTPIAQYAPIPKEVLLKKQF